VAECTHLLLLLLLLLLTLVPTCALGLLQQHLSLLLPLLRWRLRLQGKVVHVLSPELEEHHACQHQQVPLPPAMHLPAAAAAAPRGQTCLPSSSQRRDQKQARPLLSLLLLLLHLQRHHPAAAACLIQT
jgi:hypothetical protein